MVTRMLRRWELGPWTSEPAMTTPGAWTRPVNDMLPALPALVLLSLIVGTGCTQRCPEEVPSFSEDPKGVHQWYMPALGVPDAWRVQRGDPGVIGRALTVGILSRNRL